MSPALESSNLQTLVRERIEDWMAGQTPDAAGVIAMHPELRGARSLVLDLALAEFNLRKAAGDAIENAEFSERFPSHRQAILKQLAVQQALDCFPAFAADDERARWPVPGDQFFGYDIVEPLGRGGLARVFLAREPAVGGRYVVIKISRYSSREAHTLGKLSHPGIVPIHSVRHDEVEGWTVICMPLVGVATAIDLLDAAFASGIAPQSGSVVALVARETKPLTPVPLPELPTESQWWQAPYAEAIARLGLTIAEALVQAHSVGILHRDIKPSNILLSWSGRPMLLDFNLSTDASERGERLAGTFAYMAPELIASLLAADGDAGDRFDPRGDVYSLGAVLYELLTRRLPVRPDNAERLPPTAGRPWLECKRQPIQPLSGPNSPIDARLERIVLKCLAYDPAERYATAADLAQDLRSYLSTRATLARYANRHRREFLLGGLALAGSTIGAAIYVGTRPTELEVVYRRALSEYDQGKFDDAAKSFTRCLEIRSGWPNAFFGRAQALRRAGQWDAARTDYMALEQYDKAWAFAYAGYCHMRLGYRSNAAIDFSRAYSAGLRDFGMLFNYGNTEVLRQMAPLALPIFSEIIRLDPNNKMAIRNRGMAHSAAVMNYKKLPLPQAFEDARKYCQLEPESFEAPYCAAIIFGDAAINDAGYESQAVAYLSEALRKGMPMELIKIHSRPLKRLLPYVDQALIFAARPKDPDYVFNIRPVIDPPDTADWDAFERRHRIKPPLIAQAR